MTTTERQARADEITFNLFVDCGRSFAETARQGGIARSTVRARVSRHSQRLSGTTRSDEDRARSRRVEAIFARILNP